jgi:hypothetical protein
MLKREQRDVKDVMFMNPEIRTVDDISLIKDFLTTNLHEFKKFKNHDMRFFTSLSYGC